jgi:hypothetical protein
VATVSDRTLDLDDRETRALAVGAGGVAALLLGWILGSGLLRLLGFSAAAVGGGLYAREKLAERSEKIDAAKESIRSELDDLDPVARAQVMKGIAQSELSGGAE